MNMNTKTEDDALAPRELGGWSGGLDPSLVKLLARHKVAVERVDPCTLRLLAVPVSREFTKPRTNVLLRGRGHGGSHVFVDSDLGYRGANERVVWALAGPVRQNWRMLRIPPVPGGANEVLGAMLEFLSSPLRRRVQRIAATRGQRVLERPGTRLLAAASELITPAQAAEAFAGSFRQELARKLAVLTTRATPPHAALICGPPGCGRDHLLVASAAPLIDARTVSAVYRVSAARIAAGCVLPNELDIVLAELLNEAAALSGSLLLIQEFDLCISRTPVSLALVAGALERGLRFIATVRSAGFLARLRSDESLARRLLVVMLDPPSRAEAVEVAQRFAANSLIEIAPVAVQAAVHRAEQQGAAAPAGAISLLGAATADAAWDFRGEIQPDDIFAVLESQWPEDAR